MKKCDRCKDNVVIGNSKFCNACATYVFKKRRKIELVKYKGGKCEICGYDKCLSSFDFHHVDPKEKNFTLSERGSFVSFEIAKKEADKCLLVCSNCHREIHFELGSEFDKELSNFDRVNFPQKERTIRCEECGIEFKSKNKNKRFCSNDCKFKSFRKVKNRPTMIELKQLMEKYSFYKIGKMFNIRDTSVKRWAVGYGLIES